ncbi:S-adenosyl-L-methionine-dependent methyltransferase [Apiospora hydei]|uniref:S-adenosyl-L-methionine-dependent methyltransferase n=1 Tax=Apiospora hydei TaxID=1337664 RepID=A0ABR1X3F7_9PEZI
MANTEGSAPAHYDSFATSYDEIWRVPGIRPLLPLLTSTLESVGPHKDIAVLDLACGTGIGLRVMQALGARRFVGVDISTQMLELYAADCARPLAETVPALKDEQGRFDVVLGMWLLNYAPSAAELVGMWANVAAYLKPGGRFVGTMENHEAVTAPRLQSGKYGVTETELNPLPGGHAEDGFQVHLRFQTEPVVEFDAFRMKKDVFEREAAKAGMINLQYKRPGLDEVKKMIAEGIGAPRRRTRRGGRSCLTRRPTWWSWRRSKVSRRRGFPID